jgi:hypothetical protein
MHQNGTSVCYLKDLVFPPCSKKEEEEEEEEEEMLFEPSN